MISPSFKTILTACAVVLIASSLASGCSKPASSTLPSSTATPPAPAVPDPTSTPTTGLVTATPRPSPAFTPTLSASPTLTITPTFTLIPTDAVLVGAGDIAVCGVAGSRVTAELLAGIPGTIFTAGDSVNQGGQYDNYLDCFDPTWGRFKDRIRPAPGNHDYTVHGAKGYFKYFGTAAGDPKRGWYSYDLGGWHIVVLNGSCEEIGGCKAGSPQEIWLKADLAAHPAQCSLAYWHQPRFSSGEHGNNKEYIDIWQNLYDAGVEVVINGHDHDYERFAPQDPLGNLDETSGIREFVVGAGGANMRTSALDARKRNSLVLIEHIWGVLKLTLHPAGYDWEFITQPGSGVTDTGSDVCH